MHVHVIVHGSAQCSGCVVYGLGAMAAVSIIMPDAVCTLTCIICTNITGFLNQANVALNPLVSLFSISVVANTDGQTDEKTDTNQIP